MTPHEDAGNDRQHDDGRSGTEQRQFRVVGYMKAGEFVELLRKALGGATAS